jgi:hypothetical protein
MGTTARTAAAPLSRASALFGVRLRSVFVWGVWAVLSAGLVGYVWLVNDDFPIADDWHLVPVYTGYRPVNLSWLWEQYNEHRLPLPKLLLVLGGAVTGHDYRTGVLLSGLALAALAGLMIFTAGRLRGGPSFADAFFPLVLLHWGQSETLLISYALNLVASTFLAGVILIVLVRLEKTPTLGQGLVIGSCLLALPLCGSNGAALVPPLVLWLAVAAVVCWRSGTAHARRDGVVLMVLAIAAAVLLAVYLGSLEKGAGPAFRPTPLQAVQTAVEFLTASLGPFARTSWPISGVVGAVLGLLTLLRLRRDWRTEPTRRLRTLGLAGFGAAMLCLAAGIGWGRPSGFETRYVTMAVPILCLAYFVARDAPRPIVAWGLFALTALLFIANTQHGVVRAEARRERMRELQADIAAGLTPNEMAQKWAGPIFAANGEAVLRDRFEMLRLAHQGPYREHPGR